MSWLHLLHSFEQILGQESLYSRLVNLNLCFEVLANFFVLFLCIDVYFCSTEMYEDFVNVFFFPPHGTFCYSGIFICSPFVRLFLFCLC